METIGILLDFMTTQSVQVAAVFGVVAVVNWMLRNRSAHVRYLLWLVVLVKCVTPPIVTFSLPVLPGETALQVPSVGRLETMELGAVEPVYVRPEPAVNTGVPVLEQKQEHLAPQRNLDAAKTDRPGLSKTTLCVILWAAGAACYLLWALGRAVLLQRRLKHIRRPLPAELMIEQIETLARLWDYPGGFNVWLMDGISQPFVWGVWRGAIYLPTHFQSIETDRQKAIIIHEMAHVVRLDAFVNLLQILIQGVFWFHPLVWLANRVIRQEREKCCDEIAVARLGTAPREYGSAIVDTLLQEAQTTLAIPTLAVAGPVRNIEDRIKTIMQPGRRFFRRPSMAAILIIGLLAAVIVPTTIALTHKVTPPDYMLSGTVMDAQSGQPIAGAIVLDDGYGPQPYQKGITDAAGKFEYKSWNEEHTITAKAEGYHSQSMVFMTWPLDNSKQLNFKLRKLSNQNNSPISIDLRTISISNDEAQLKALFDKAGVHLPQFAMSVTPSDVNTQVPDKLSYGQSAFLTRHEVEKIIEAMQSNPDVRLLCSPKVIVFSGESANLEISGVQTAPAGQKEFSVHITPTAAANGILSEFRLILSDSPGGQENPLTQLTQIESKVLIPQDKTLLIICPDFYQDSAGQQTAASKPQRRLLILLKTQVESASETQTGESSDASAGIAMSKRIDLAPAEFDLQIDPQRGVCFPVVTIANEGKEALPKMKLRFYRGSPEKDLDETGNPHDGWHEAGPIEPGKTWRERTDGFHLDDGVYEFAVVLDYDHAIAETDETNNAMSMLIKVVNGQVAEKLAALSIRKQMSIEARMPSSQLASGIIEAVLLPEYLESHTVLSLKMGRLMPQQQADDSKEPYLFYSYTFPPGQSPSQYTVNTIPERYIGVEAGGMNTGGFGWAPESSGLQHLWSIDRIEDLPDCPQRAIITIGNMTIHGMFIGLPLPEPEREKQWPFITAFKGDDGTSGVFEITKIENRKIFVKFKRISLPGVIMSTPGVRVPASEVQKIFLPELSDAEKQGKGLLLDLASSQMLKVPSSPPKDAGPYGLCRYYNELGIGDLMYAKPSLVIIRGGQAKVQIGEQWKNFKPSVEDNLVSAFELPFFPCIVEVTTPENKTFRIQVIREENDGLWIEYDRNTVYAVKSEADSSQSILLERKELLQKMLKTEEQKFQSGISGPMEVLEAKMNLLAVEKELSGTSQERIVVLHQIAALRQEAENTTKLMFESGRATEAELHQAKLERLKAEEELAGARLPEGAHGAMQKRILRFPDAETRNVLFYVEPEKEGSLDWWWPNPITKNTFSVPARGEAAVDADKNIGLILHSSEEGDPLSALEGLAPDDLHTLIIHGKSGRSDRQTIVDTNVASCIRLEHLQCLILNGAIVSKQAIKKLTGMKSIERLSIYSSQLDDEDVGQISQMKGLKGLRVYGDVGNKGFEFISTMENLEELFTGGKYVSDESIRYISTMKNLKTLTLAKEQCTEKGLQYLSALDSLATLKLLGFEIGPEGAGYLAKIKNLKSLAINRAISDQAMEQLKNMNWLTQLTLQLGLQHSGNKLTDAGLLSLNEMKSLESVSIYYGSFTDEGLKQLSGLWNLKRLEMPNTTLSEEAYQYLRKVLPHLEGMEFRNFGSMRDKIEEVKILKESK
ncbi:MAG: M56 family metallopeptidase [Anaerohalosphaeraceae bacterium]